MYVKSVENTEFVPDTLGEVPQTVYKFRSWADVYHRKIFTDKELWFAHPFTLNDHQDLRQPSKVVIDRLLSYDAYRHWWDYVSQIYPDATRKFKKTMLDVKFREIQADPVGYFQKGLLVTQANADDYDIFGVLSLTDKVLEDEVWERYGDKHKGFCIGFNTNELSRDMMGLYGKVVYSDSSLNYDPLKEYSGQEIASGFFKKTTAWKNESEYRFLTARIESQTDRAKKFSDESVAEVILGCNISDDHEKQIVSAVRENFDREIPILRCRRRLAMEALK